MNLVDRLFIFFAIVAIVFTALFMAYEYGQKTECRASKGKWSLEFGECVR